MSFPSRSNRTAGTVGSMRAMDTNEPSSYHGSHARTGHARGEEVPPPAHRRRSGARRDHDRAVLRAWSSGAAGKDPADVRCRVGGVDADHCDDADEEDQTGTKT